MAGPTFEELHREFLTTFRGTALHKHRYEVFKDFVTMSAITLRNAVRMNDELEAEYLTIIKGYKKPDQMLFPKLFTLLVELLQFGPRDVLGSLFEALELSSKDKGQFFTPHPVSELMADLLGTGELDLGEKPFITLSEPACGAGGMVLAFVRHMQKAGYNPAERLWVQAIDVDRMAALMCYVQLSLWHVPAEVIVGNTLSMEFREVWYTPAHVLGFWDHRLRKHWQSQATKREPEPSMAGLPTETSEPQPSVPKPDTSKPFQFDFGF